MKFSFRRNAENSNKYEIVMLGFPDEMFADETQDVSPGKYHVIYNEESQGYFIRQIDTQESNRVKICNYPKMNRMVQSLNSIHNPDFFLRYVDERVRCINFFHGHSRTTLPATKIDWMQDHLDTIITRANKLNLYPLLLTSTYSLRNHAIYVVLEMDDKRTLYLIYQLCRCVMYEYRLHQEADFFTDVNEFNGKFANGEIGDDELKTYIVKCLESMQDELQIIYNLICSIKSVMRHDLVYRFLSYVENVDRVYNDILQEPNERFIILSFFAHIFEISKIERTFFKKPLSIDFLSARLSLYEIQSAQKINASYPIQIANVSIKKGHFA